MDRRLLFLACSLFGDEDTKKAAKAARFFRSGASYKSIASDDGWYAVSVNTRQPFAHLKRKKDGIYIGVYEGILLKDESDMDIVVKVFLTLSVPRRNHSSAILIAFQRRPPTQRVRHQRGHGPEAAHETQ